MFTDILYSFPETWKRRAKLKYKVEHAFVYNVKICLKEEKKKKEEKLRMRIPWAFGFDLGFVLKRREVPPILKPRGHRALSYEDVTQ